MRYACTILKLYKSYTIVLCISKEMLFGKGSVERTIFTFFTYCFKVHSDIKQIKEDVLKSLASGGTVDYNKIKSLFECAERDIQVCVKILHHTVISSLSIDKSTTKTSTYFIRKKLKLSRNVVFIMVCKPISV